MKQPKEHFVAFFFFRKNSCYFQIGSERLRNYLTIPLEKKNKTKYRNAKVPLIRSSNEKVLFMHVFKTENGNQIIRIWSWLEIRSIHSIKAIWSLIFNVFLSILRTFSLSQVIYYISSCFFIRKSQLIKLHSHVLCFLGVVTVQYVITRYTNCVLS